PEPSVWIDVNIAAVAEQGFGILRELPHSKGHHGGYRSSREREGCRAAERTEADRAVVFWPEFAQTTRRFFLEDQHVSGLETDGASAAGVWIGVPGFLELQEININRAERQLDAREEPFACSIEHQDVAGVLFEDEHPSGAIALDRFPLRRRLLFDPRP